MHYFFQMHYCYTLEYTYFRLESSRRPAEIWIWTACQMLLWQRILFEIFFVSFLGMPSANLLFLLYWRWDLLVLKVIQQWLRYSEAHWWIVLINLFLLYSLVLRNINLIISLICYSNLKYQTLTLCCLFFWHMNLFSRISLASLCQY